MAQSFHASDPFFNTFLLYFERFIDPMGVVGMEENDGLGKKGGDDYEKKDKNANAGLEVDH
jgi:hypothetical protein